jgi:enoyl-CoA hydratase/carnithine racemase
MVDRLVPADEFEAQVTEVATAIAAGAPLALAATKRAVHDGADRPLADGLRTELDALAPLFSTEDAAEGMAAFLEKRPAKYRGA